MTQVRTLAAYEIVRHLFPRPPPTEIDEIARATGKAIDSALAYWSHAQRQNLRLTATAVQKMALGTLNEELQDADVTPSPEARTKAEREIAGVLQAFRKSEVFGLARPRSRLVLIDRTVGVYAQPDFSDGVRRFYEMKTFRAVPPPPDVALQVSIFQLAFPEQRSFLACFDRHKDPVETCIEEVPPPTAESRTALLRQMREIGLLKGIEKVLEYIDTQVVGYTLEGTP